jgi:hypothetical protein
VPALTPSRHDVLLVNVQWRDCADVRPALVTRLCADGRVLCALISSAFDLYNPSIHFAVRDSQPEFAQTGLLRSSYVSSQDVPLLESTCFVRRLGSLGPLLSAEFDGWWMLRGGM